MSKLTKAQLDVLETGQAVAVNGEFIAGFIADHWEKEWATRSIAGTLRGLVTLGLVERMGRGNWTWYRITDAGRAALQNRDESR